MLGQQFKQFSGAFNPFVDGAFGSPMAQRPMNGGMVNNPLGFGAYSTGPRGGAGGLRWNYSTGWGYGGQPQQQPNDPLIPLIGRSREEIQQHISGLPQRFDPHEADRPGYMPSTPQRRQPYYSR